MDGQRNQELSQIVEEMGMNSPTRVKEQQEQVSQEQIPLILSQLEPPTGSKCPLFVLIGGSNWDQWPEGLLVPVRAINRDK